MAKHGRPEIFNTDQGSQFTSLEFTDVLLDAKIAISMDGKGAWRDNVFVERLWRTVKYEEVYLRAYDSVSEARASIAKYLAFYNQSYAGFWVTRRSGGVVFRHLDDLDAVFESDTCDDLRQLICAFQPPPGL
ncbi:transposase InsO family protein [Bradyrhizobium sp. USDA 241]